MKTAWQERYEGGGPEAERLLFEKLAIDIMKVQLKNQQSGKQAALARVFHAKPVYDTTSAELRFVDDLPPSLQAGFAQPGKRYPATVRLSNADGVSQSDHKRDLRGVAVRVAVDETTAHDLLATSYPVSHARNARQFVAFAKATAGGPIGRFFGLIGLVFQFGPSETLRMLNNILHARRESASLALESYWSRGAIRWGETAAVRYQFRPAAGTPPAPPPKAHDSDFLSSEFASRVTQGEVRFDILVQLFVDEKSTPIEDTAVEWTEKASPPVKVATLVIGKPADSDVELFADGRIIEEIAFNPWNTTDEFRPLGNLNRARKAVYDASSAHRLRNRFLTVVPLRNRAMQAIIPPLFSAINEVVPWHKLPLQLSLLNLDAFRFVLRRKNLIDTDIHEAPPQARSVPPPTPEQFRLSRDDDGRYNDLSSPEMGSAGAAFGRNIPPILRPDLFDTPDMITVSRELLQRKRFLPATSLNILAAAWIQFQVHDWVNHKRQPLGVDDVIVPLPKGMTWQSSVGGMDEPEMRISGNTGFLSPPGNRPPIYKNTETHWWDASQLYGDVLTKTGQLRAGAKIRLENGYLPLDVSGFEATGFNQNWWLGLSAMHTLFAREHNVLCDELRSAYRDWSEERIFQTARLIVAALIAKIHTIEWTPAILGTKALEVGMNANWSGPPNNFFFKAGLWLVDAHGLKGIPQTTPDHTGAPYCLTEDFITVYRMHPLIPDDYCFYDSSTGRKLSDATFLDIQGDNTDRVMREKGLKDVLYAFGTAYPGAITLHNFPLSLMKFERDGEIIDLSVVDLARTRRRGVPRYNDFRAGLHKPRIARWEDLTADPQDARLLRDIYKDIDLVDTMVGLYAETPPAGFGFSDTAFRIFILMASRRLQSDRFLNVDFRPEVYSPLGMDWVANNGMKTVIQRHCPELAPLFPETGSAFAPWRRIVPGG